ncbi:hypothetical protein EVAR_29854_1 [Eumeta japonica]|uniref:Uncharacterized protein n=1 Tax=Eumeta variegata TaxID=151549 RepID=A0A4C1VSY4_EUMVA|nr:hypothetical protein EVAR_29854_1 [Eumeta japonica]
MPLYEMSYSLPRRRRRTDDSSVIASGRWIVTVNPAFVICNRAVHSICVTAGKSLHHFARPINTTEFLSVDQIMGYLIELIDAHEWSREGASRVPPISGARDDRRHYKMLIGITASSLRRKRRVRADRRMMKP